MNELIKIDNSEEELFEYLVNKETFQDFFTAVCQIKILCETSCLRRLKSVVSKFSYKYTSDSIVYLCDCIDTEMAAPCRNVKDVKLNEKKYQEIIIEQFSNIFPQFLYKGQEVIVAGVGRIDILAQDILSNRDVIIELKMNNKNPNKQLIAYGSHYKNPILIGISENTINKDLKQDNILYYTYDELKISKYIGGDTIAS